MNKIKLQDPSGSFYTNWGHLWDVHFEGYFDIRAEQGKNWQLKRAMAGIKGEKKRFYIQWPHMRQLYTVASSTCLWRFDAVGLSWVRKLCEQPSLRVCPFFNQSARSSRRHARPKFRYSTIVTVRHYTIRPVTTYSNRIARNAQLSQRLLLTRSRPRGSPRLNLLTPSWPKLFL